MAADGSVVFDVKFDIGQADKDLAKLKGKIEKTEKDIASFQKERDAARGKYSILGGELDNEKRKLEALKSDLLDVKNILKDKTVSTSTREEALANLPGIQERVKEQQERVRLLQAEFNRLGNSVDRYDKKIESSNADLLSMKEEAGGLERSIAAAAAQTQKLADTATVSDQHIVNLSQELEELQAKMSSLKEVGIGVGYEEYDKTAARIREINSELKKYNVGLSKTGKSKKQVSNTADAFNKLSKRIRSSAAAALNIGGKAVYSGLKKLGELAKRAATSFYNLFRNTKRADRGFSFSLKSMLRYSLGIESLFTALNKVREGITDGIKNLVQVSDSTNQSVSSLLSSLTLLKNSLATAFAPILEIAAPILTKFIDMLSSASDHVARLFARLAGKTSYKKAVKVQQNYAESLKDTSKSAKDGADGIEGIADSAEDAEESIEESEKAMASFDEINQLVFQEDKKRNEKDKEEKKKGAESLEDEVGKVSPEDMFEDVEIEPLDFSSWGEAFNAFLDYLLNKGIPALQNAFSLFAGWLNGFTSNVYEMLKFPGVQEKVALLGGAIAASLNGLVSAINWDMLGKALGAGLNTALSFLLSYIFTFNWAALGTSLASAVNGLASEVDWQNFGALLWSGFMIALTTLAGFLTGLDMPLLAQAATDVITGFFNSMNATISGINWKEIGEQIRTFLVNIDWKSIADSIMGAVKSALTASSDFFSGLLGEEVKQQVVSILAELSKALLVIGALLAFSGVNVRLGLGLMAAGVKALAVVGVLDWGYLSNNLRAIITDVLNIFGSAALVIGAVLAFSGVNVKVGLALIAAGAAAKATSLALNWESIPEAIQGPLSAVLGILSGAVLVLGAILTFTGVNIKVGVALMAMGAATLATVFAVNWDTISEALQGSIGVITALVSGALLVFGVILAFTGVNLPLGIGMIAAGAVGLATAIAANWETISGLLGGSIEAISTLLDAALLVIGVILVFTGVGVPLGLGMILAGAVGMVTELATNWNYIKEKLAETWEGIKSWWNQNVEKFLTADYWKQLGADIIDGFLGGLKRAWDSVTQWASNAKNTLKSLFGGAEQSASSIASANIGSGRYSTYSSYPAISAMPAISTYDIPQLAAGAVIPPNREFLAVLGDQRSGTNIEAPEDLIRRIVREESGNTQTARILEQILEVVRKGAVVELDQNKIGRVIYSSYNKENKRVGVSLVNGVR